MPSLQFVVTFSFTSSLNSCNWIPNKVTPTSLHDSILICHSRGYGSLVSVSSGERFATVEGMYCPNLFRQPRGLRFRTVATCSLGLRVRILSEAWMTVSCKCCVLYRWRHLRPFDPSSRAFYRVLVCPCVISGVTVAFYTYSEQTERRQTKRSVLKASYIV